MDLVDHGLLYLAIFGDSCRYIQQYLPISSDIYHLASYVHVLAPTLFVI